MRKNQVWLIIALCFVSAALGYGVSRRIYRGDNIAEARGEDAVAASETVQKITPSTKIVYEYYYPEDDVTEVYEDVPPYFLIDYTLEDMKRVYSNWVITSFSNREVVMKKNVSGPSNQRYVIGEKDGYVAVFYDIENEGLILKEITEEPISALTESERTELEKGINITGNDKLLRALEDYTS